MQYNILFSIQQHFFLFLLYCVLTATKVSAIVTVTKVAEGGGNMKADTNKLHLALARACMNPQDLARAAEMPPQTVNGVLRGRSVRPATIGRIAKALGVDVAEILEKEE